MPPLIKSEIVGKLGSVIKSSDFRTLFNNLASLGFLRGFDILIPLLVTPYLIRVVGLGGYGLLVLSASFSAYFGAVIQYGFNITAVRDISRLRDDPAALSEVFSVIWAIQICLAVACAVGFSLIVFFIPYFYENTFLYFSSLFLVSMQSVFPGWFFIGIERMKFVTLLVVPTKMLYIVGLIFLINEPDDYLFVHLLHGVCVLFSVIVAGLVVRIRFGIRFAKPELADMAKTMLNGRDSFMTQITPTLYNNTATVILGIYGGNILVGAYAAASTIVEVFVSFGRVISSVFLPYLSVNINKHKYYEKSMLMLGALLMLILLLYSQEFLSLLYKDIGGETSLYLKLMSPGVLAAFMFLVYNTNFLMLVGRESVARNISIFVSIVFLVLALLAIPLWNVYAAIAVVVGARVSMAFLSLSACKKVF